MHAKELNAHEIIQVKYLAQVRKMKECICRYPEITGHKYNCPFYNKSVGRK